MTEATDPSFQLLAVNYTARQLKKLPRELEGLRDSVDIEHLHQSRVASRRLGVALQAFGECFAAKQVKRWRKDLRRLLKTLGPARDKDVQIEYVRGLLAGLKEKAHRPGMGRLLLRLEQERRELQPKLLKAVEAFEAARTTVQMQSAVKQLLAALGNRQVGLQSPLVFQRSRDLILCQLQRFVAYQDCLWNPQDIERHHEMRIEAKHFRYMMETCSAAYPGKLKPFITAAKSLQTLLGDLHDCDVWIDQLEAFLESERQRTIDYFGHGRSFVRLKAGIEWLLEQRLAQRKKLFRQLGDLWNELSQKRAWEKLVRKLDSCVKQAAPVQPSEVRSAPAAQGDVTP